MTASHSSTDVDTWRGLFHELAAGRRRALDALYRSFSKQLYGFAVWHTGSAEDAADVVHDVFIRLVEQRHRLEAVDNPRAWLLTVTHRAAIDCVRRRSRRRATPIDECLFLEAPYDDADRRLDARHASAHVAALPAAQRDVIYLHLFADCTFAEIGNIVGAPTFTAASRYRLGMKKLRRMLEDSR